jgi:two-component system, OmpR family, sensor kinase
VNRRSFSVFAKVYVHGVGLLAMSFVVALVGVRLTLQPALVGAVEKLNAYLGAQLCALPDAEAARRALGDFPVEAAVLDGTGRQVASTAGWVEPPRGTSTGAGAPGAGEGLVRVVCHGGGVGREVMIRPPNPTPSLPRFAVVLLVSLALLALVSRPLARSIAAPLERLVVASRALGRGELGARANVERGDELGELSEAFDEMAERLESLIRAEKELLANVSHELRTPMARLRVALELLDESPELARRYVPGLTQDLSELERMLEDIMATTRLEIGRGTPELLLRRAATSAIELARAAASRARERWPDVAIEVREGAPAAGLEADPVLVRRLIENLIDNAAKHSNGRGPVSVSVSLVASGAAPGVEVRIEDRGEGVAQADLARVFEPFFRVDTSRSRSTGGVGLGLTLARRIAEAHGGSIRIESRLGEGTTATVWLPRPISQGRSGGEQGEVRGRSTA